MRYAVLGAWVIQAVVGTTLLVGWARRARSGVAPAVHAVIMLVCLAGWVVFVVTGLVAWAWAAVAALCAGIPFGEVMMVRRSRSIRRERNPGLRDYGSAIRTVFEGRMPPRVTFHALFSAVVFFGSLGVAIGATVAAPPGG